MRFIKNKYVRFAIAAVLYILFVIWLENYWFLFGLVVIFDIYITQKVNWTPWKKRHGKNSALVEWIDALIFAVVAVTLINIFLFQNYKIPTGSMEKSLLIGDHLYVSKVAYGPRIPNTPLSFPFAQHTMPLIGTKSYLEWIKLPYKRLEGFTKIKRNDVVVFNFPAGDTVVLQQQTQDYYGILIDNAQQFRMLDIQNNRQLRSQEEYIAMARDYIWDNYDVVVRPVDRRDNYIKRCVAMHGDTLEIINRRIHINGVPEEQNDYLQFQYRVTTNGQPFNPKALERIGISSNDVKGRSGSDYILLLTDENVEKIKNFNNVQKVQTIQKPKNTYSPRVFPHDPRYPWNEDNFGPLYIPEKGATINLTPQNLPLYKRIIETYEQNEVTIRDNQIYINGEVATTYTFKMNYFFMMGDNRHDSLDSRFWGFVPEDHVVGKPKFIWLSLDPDKDFLSKIRLKRMFMGIR
jgi:signal peptidase I